MFENEEAYNLQLHQYNILTVQMQDLQHSTGGKNSEAIHNTQLLLKKHYDEQKALTTDEIKTIKQQLAQEFLDQNRSAPAHILPELAADFDLGENTLFMVRSA